MGNIFTDVVAAVKVTRGIREARKAGADAVRVEPIRIVPCATLPPAFLNTMEGRNAWNMGMETYQAVKEFFENLPYETRKRMEYIPENPGEWAKRARFWQSLLKPVLPPNMYHAVMVKFISWYAHRLRRRKEATA